MKIKNKGKCLFLAVLILLTCIGCSGDPNNSTQTGNNLNGGSQGNNQELPYREPFIAEEEVVYEDNDHLFDYESKQWDGPKDYVIVVPKGDDNALETAKVLVDYYKESLNITLEITTDNNKE